MAVKSYRITEPVLNGVLQYLGQRPHDEVRGLIDALAREVVPQNQPKPAKPEKPE